MPAPACRLASTRCIRPARLRTDELLVVTPPEPLDDVPRRSGNYLPKGIPLLKHIAALPGQTVCRTGDTISIDGITVGVQRATGITWDARCPFGRAAE